MAAGSFIFYNPGKLAIIDGTVDLDNDNVQAVLLTSAYTPSASSQFYANISASVTSTGDYSPKVLGSKAYTRTAAQVKFDAADVSYGTGVTITAKYVALVETAVTSAIATGDLLIGYVNLATEGGSVSSTAAAFSLTWATSGIFTAS